MVLHTQFASLLSRGKQSDKNKIVKNAKSLKNTIPHFERLNKKSPTTHEKQFVFFPKGGKLKFATFWEVEKASKVY